MMDRVSKKRPCPVCGRTDWCLVAPDGSAAICQRVQEGSRKRSGDAGWLHILKNVPNVPNRPGLRYQIIPLKRPDKDYSWLAERFQQYLNGAALNSLSTNLGITENSLKRLQTGWTGKAYTFPMSDQGGKIIGIRTRFPNGTKRCVKGSRTGLFIPEGLSKSDLLLILEGESDTAAALDLGFNGVGRPGCGQATQMLRSFCKSWDEVVIVGDNDGPGRQGAEKLARSLALYCKQAKVIYPPQGVKDIRQWLKGGTTHEEVRSVIKASSAVKAKLTFVSQGGRIDG